MNKALLCILLAFLLYSFENGGKTYQGYTAADLRDLYGSGDPSVWPKPHLFEEAKAGFRDIGPLGKVPFPESNPYSKEKEELGKLLFFDPRLSESGQISCANCHNPEIAWTDGSRVSYGHNRQQGTRNAPTIINIGYATELFWDGRATTLEQQVSTPVESKIEMNMHYKRAAHKIRRIRQYRDCFKKAFGNDNITQEQISMAIATFERTIASPKSRFDKFVEGKKNELTDSEIRGLHLFRTKANCINCHNTPYFSDQKFHNEGLTYFGREYEDLGLYNITKKPSDVGKFKTSTLREISQTSPYMHNGLFPELRGVLNMYNAGMPNEKRYRDSILAPHKSSMLVRLELSEDELSDLENFLQTLHSYRYKMRAPELPSDHKKLIR